MRLRVVALVFLAGCSGGNLTTTLNGGVLYGPCAEETDVGGFSIDFSGPSAGGSVFYGTVANRSLGSDYWRTLASEGACELITPDPAIACDPPCTGADGCYPDGTCAPDRITLDVGIVEISGLTSGSRSFEAYLGDYKAYESNPGDLPSPPAAPGAVISLRAAGGSSAPFTLDGRGFAPLSQTGAPLTVTPGQPLALAWEPPSEPVTTRLLVHLVLARDEGLLEGPSADFITCNLPDNGAGTIPALLLDPLIDHGVGTGPLLQLERLTVSSTQIAQGCVSFVVRTRSEQAVVVSP